VSAEKKTISLQTLCSSFPNLVDLHIIGSGVFSLLFVHKSTFSLFLDKEPLRKS